MPAVSVVIPLYNKAAYIGRCLESVRVQTMTDFEVVVVDDGSTDGSGDIAAGFVDSRIRVIRQPNGGEGAARNRGIRESQSRLIAFLDADDEWERDFLSAVVNLAARYPQAGIFATGLRRLLDEGWTREITLARPNPDGTQLVSSYFRHVREGDFVTSSSVAIPAAVLAEIGTFAQGEPIGADGDLWARIALHYPIAYDARILATYHTEAEGRSFHMHSAKPPYPPVVRRLRAMGAAGRIPAAVSADVQSYADWRLIRYAHWLLALGHRGELKALLRERPFTTQSFRVQGWLLKAALAFLPMRLIGAILWKPARIIAALRATSIGRALLGTGAPRFVSIRDFQPDASPQQSEKGELARTAHSLSGN